jgi:hypothetical protein
MRKATVARKTAPPSRHVAALRRWLRAANARLMLVQRQREQNIALATALLEGLGQPKKERTARRPRLASRMAKAG